MEESELLALVRSERQSSIGFDHDGELVADRERALRYYKGEMPDVPALPNRSKAVSTDVADAIETILPDLVEIFTGGEDVAAFIPRGQEDEQAAQQETDYVNHIVFNENDGWMAFYSAFKDALTVKTGIIKAWAEACPPEVEEFTGRTAVEVQAAMQAGTISDEVVSREASLGQEALYDFKITRPAYKKVKIAPVPPEDFTVAADTTALSQTTYCAMRSRPRAQDLILSGFDAKKVEKLSAYGKEDDGNAAARDTAGEHENASGADNLLRRVEIVEHVLRVVEGKEAKLYRITTGEDEAVLLQKEEIDRVPFCAITPFPVTHRFYGESVADKLMEIQKVNTALTRMALDSGYFALNQRLEVSEAGMTANTLPDLLRNEPGVPIRVKTAGTVVPVTAGALAFDVFGALEYFQTKAEQRTGIVRAAQGLTPDTLHETAKGALALLTAAQKRVRLIARIFAETGVKELFLSVHALLRAHGSKAAKVRLRNKWVDIDPTSWGSRADMTIEVGLGASGREADVMALTQEGALMEKIIAMQGGPVGPIIMPQHVHAWAHRFFEKLGNKAPEKFLGDPAEAPPQQPQPDPKMAEVQAKMQLQQQQAEFTAQLETQKAGFAADMEQAKSASAAEQARYTADLNAQVRREQIGGELALKREQLAAELGLKREQLEAELILKQQAMMLYARQRAEEASVKTSEVEMGGAAG